MGERYARDQNLREFVRGRLAGGRRLVRSVGFAVALDVQVPCGIAYHVDGGGLAVDVEGGAAGDGEGGGAGEGIIGSELEGARVDVRRTGVGVRLVQGEGVAKASSHIEI